MSQTNWEADKMLDVYIYDYLVKRNLHASAKAFQVEGKVSNDPVAIDAPGGFLFEWWSVFWDIFIARTNENHSDVALSYIETQQMKAREQQQQQLPTSSQQRHLHMQQLVMQRHAQQQQQQQQQQRRDGPHILNGTTNGLIGNDSIMRQSPGTANALPTKMYEERLKVPLRESVEDASMKQRFGENMGTMMDTGNPAMLKPTVASGHSSGQSMHAASGTMPGSLPQIQSRNPQLSGSIEDIKPEINPILNARTAGPDGSLVGIHGSNQGGSNLTLKGYPLTINELRSGMLPQKPFMQSPQAIHQLQMLNPQQQQQLLLQAQQNLMSPSAADVDTRRLRMLMNNKNMMGGRDIQSNSIGEVIPSVGSLQIPGLPSGEDDIMLKIAQMQQHQPSSIQQQQLMQQAISSQQSHSSSKPPQHQDKTGAVAASNAAMMGNTSNSLRGNDQALKSQSGRKRKQTLSSSEPANSSGTANTQGPSPSSAPSTPSTHSPGDVISMPTMPQSGSSSKPMMVFNPDGAGPLASPSNQLWDDKADLLVEDGSLEDNVESFLHDDNDPRETASRSMDINKGSTLSEIGSVRASTSKVVCCHFSSDGKLLATGGQDKKAMLWHTDTLKLKTTLEEHSLAITDVRFSPSMSRLATSSFDKTVRVWDADNPGYSLRTFTGHSASVMSVDFHPNKEDLICSSDGVGEIRFWSISNGNCAGLFKGGIQQIRFQPRLGRYLAAVAENIVSIFDVDTQASCQKLQGHTKAISSVCWNASGDRLASVSDDLIRVWSLGSGNEFECINQLSSSGNKFQTCVFHPTCQSLLVIGCYETMELWYMAEGKVLTKPAHENLINSLAASNASGLVASASSDTYVKLWR